MKYTSYLIFVSVFFFFIYFFRSTSFPNHLRTLNKTVRFNLSSSHSCSYVSCAFLIPTTFRRIDDAARNASNANSRGEFKVWRNTMSGRGWRERFRGGRSGWVGGEAGKEKRFQLRMDDQPYKYFPLKERLRDVQSALNIYTIHIKIEIIPVVSFSFFFSFFFLSFSFSLNIKLPAFSRWKYMYICIWA